MARHTKYLIIGNSAAGIGGVQGIRAVDPLGSILLVSDEPYHTYSRPLISYWVEGRVDREHMNYRDTHFYEDNGVTPMLGTAVTGIDPQTKTVTLDTGETIAYDKLLLATGSHPFVPPIAGRETAKNAVTFTKMDDAVQMMEIVEACAADGRKPRVVVLGAGLIGLKAAEALADKNESLTVIDLADRVMPSVFDEKASAVMEEHLRENGFDLRLGQSITEIGDGTVTLSTGETLPYDLLVLAVGTRPASELAQAAGLECGRGIITDACQQTSAPDVYAAGDCTQSHDISSGTDKNMAILPNAFIQGQAAGRAMAGAPEPVENLFPLNSMGVLGLYLFTAGTYTGEAIVIEDEDCYKEFFVENDRLKGFIIIGECQRAGIYTELIWKQTDLNTLDRDALFCAPGMMAFGQNVRKRELAHPH